MSSASTSFEPSIRSGVTLGQYSILGHLATGSTGEVWLAIDREADGRIVVIKTLQTGKGGRRSELIASLISKARLVSRLSHPGLASVVAFGQQGETDYLVLEYVPGRNLEQILASQRLPPVCFSLAVMVRACEAVAYLHSQSLTPEDPLLSLHLCLAPKKLIVSVAGEVKLLGAGTAQAIEPLPETPSFVRYSRFGYEAPERISSGEASPRSDVYGLGAILYFLLGGRSPFHGSNLVELIHRVAEGNPASLAQLNPRVPANLQRLVSRATHPRPEERFTSVEALREELLAVALSAPELRSGRVLSAYLAAELPDLGSTSSLLSCLPDSWSTGEMPPVSATSKEAAARPAALVARPASSAPRPPALRAVPLPGPRTLPTPAAATPALPAAVALPSPTAAAPQTLTDPQTPAAPQTPTAPHPGPARQTPATPTAAAPPTPLSAPATPTRPSSFDPFAAAAGPRARTSGAPGPFATGGRERSAAVDVFAAPERRASPRRGDSRSGNDLWKRAQRDPDVFRVAAPARQSKGPVSSAKAGAFPVLRGGAPATDSRVGTSPPDGAWLKPRPDPLREAAEHFDRGVAALRRGDRQEAVRQLRAALVLDPENRRYRQNLQRLGGGER